MILYRPTGFQELKLIAASGWRTFPPRLSDQPIFYPVLNFEYARQIAEGWNTRYNDPPCGFVTRFEVNDDYAKRFEVQTVGAREHQELWVPAEELETFNANIIGRIIVEAEYYASSVDDAFKAEVQALLKEENS
jgi:hypothetical protein